MGKKQTTYGLEGLYFANMPTSGLIEDAEFVRLAQNLEGTVTLAQDADEANDIFVEESDAPLVTILKKGKFTFSSSIPDLQFSVAEKIFGATKTTAVVEGQSVTRVLLPSSAEYRFGMIKIVPKNGVQQIYITKAQISGALNGNLTKTDTLNFDFTAVATDPDVETYSYLMYDVLSGENPGYLLGNPLPENTDLVSTFSAISDGEFNIAIDGGIATDITGIDFSTITTIEEIVTKLNDSTSGATWSFNVNEFRFRCQSDTTGVSSQIVIVAVTAGAGTDIGGAGFLDVIGGDSVVGS